ncbi:MAG: DUF4910 domain-containing protein [Betaproteobacteria bacterium]|nr:DUF4910 domain-containing protein [Betaproteobacteria bacterium]
MEGTFPRHELDAHLHSLPELPDAIPYVTSYYEERWGFCLQQRLRESLPEGDYRVFIDTTLQPGSLTLGDLVIPGRSKQEIFVSTYTCHPSMANNEVSGMTVATFLARAILERGTPRFTYRFVFAPETIGPLCYLAAPGRKEHLRRQVLAAFNVTCVGDERGFSLLPSKWGDTLTDRVARHVMHHLCPNYREYTFALDRGSDECQYSSPGVDLPMVSVMRSKYGTFPEYHTSLDDLSLVTGAGLKGSFDVILRCFDALEDGISPLYTTLQAGEPWFSKYGLRSTLGAFKLDMRTILGLGNVMSYADGRHSLLDVAEKMQVPVWELFQYRQALQRVGLLRASELPIEQ